MTPRPTVPTHHDRTALLSMCCRRTTTLTNLLLNIRAILDILPKVTDMASDLLVGLERKRDHGDEAKGKPFPALHDAAAEVAAVLALYGYVLGAAELGCEGWVGVLV